MKVLFVEDEKLLADALGHLFESNGFEADTAYDGDTGYTKAMSDAYDVIVLDVMLPGKSGLDILRLLRSHGKKVPVLLLTAKDTLADKVTGLNSGADDYLVKPFETDELLARVHALARRPRESYQEETGQHFADITLLPETSEARINNQHISLTQKEAALLSLLIKNQGHPLSKEQILDAVWGKDSGTTENSVELYVHYLRKKLSGSSTRIKTIRGQGYLLTDNAT